MARAPRPIIALFLLACLVAACGAQPGASNGNASAPDALPAAAAVAPTQPLSIVTEGVAVAAASPAEVPLAELPLPAAQLAQPAPPPPRVSTRASRTPQPQVDPAAAQMTAAAAMPQPALPVATAASFTPATVPGRYAIAFDPAFADVERAINRIVSSMRGVSDVARFPQLGAMTFAVGPSVSSVDKLLAALTALPSVATVRPENVFATTQASAASAPLASGERVPRGLRRIRATIDSTIRPGSPSVRVAVVDTGINANHPDLQGVVVREGFSARGGSPLQDADLHGTHVAGTIAARNQGSGIVGVAPGVQLVSVRVLQGGTGSTTDVLNGLNWVLNNAARLRIRVINMSLSGGIDNAVCNALSSLARIGVTTVVAAGNGVQGNGVALNTVGPANCAAALAVTAINDLDGLPGGLGGPNDDKPAQFSNFATTAADAARTLAAPGVNIESLDASSNGYRMMSGTSMAAPHVAGIVALCYSRGLCSSGSASEAARMLRAASDWAAANRGYGYVGYSPPASTAATPSPRPQPSSPPPSPAPRCTGIFAFLCGVVRSTPAPAPGTPAPAPTPASGGFNRYGTMVVALDG